MPVVSSRPPTHSRGSKPTHCTPLHPTLPRVRQSTHPPAAPPPQRSQPPPPPPLHTQTDVAVYVIDTGVDTTHDEFDGSNGFTRTVSNVWDAYNDPIPENNDGDGHGTHCAGTIGGDSVGVAPAADLYGMKVLADDGTGLSSDILAAMTWVVSERGSRYCASSSPPPSL